MALSSNSIIHLTKYKSNLKGILTNNFKLKYCREEIHNFVGVLPFAVPMVSFCDIPLSQIKDHISKYGNYGIGLTKEWAKRNRLNPILYIDNNSKIGEEFHNSFLNYLSENPKKALNDTKDRLYYEMIRHMKNYEGYLLRKGKKQYYRFSDEREWRFVPDFDPSYQPIIIADYYEDEFNKRSANESLSNLRLKFEPNDINYIFIKKDSEIKEFINLLEDVKGKYTADDVKRLLTRIITTERIEKDF